MPEDDSIPTPPPSNIPADPTAAPTGDKKNKASKDGDYPRIEFQNPFRGHRGTYHRVMQPLRLIFYFPLFLNIREAMKIVRDGHGHTWGAEKIQFIYPMIPVTLILLAISSIQIAIWGEINPGFSTFAQVIWILLLALCVWTIGDDIGGKLVGAAIGVIIAILAIVSVLQFTGIIDIVGGVGGFIYRISPKFDTGTAILTTILFGAMYIKSYIKTRVHQTLTTNGNRWNPSRIATDASYDSGFHRLYSTTPDWLERAFFRSRSICICSSQDHIRKDDDEIETKAVYMLPNVAGASTVIAAIEYAASRLEVDHS